MTVLLSTTSSLRNFESSVDPRQLLFRHVNDEKLISTTSSVSFFSWSEESLPGKNSPSNFAENFDVHRGILGGKFSLTDSLGQGVLNVQHIVNRGETEAKRRETEGGMFESFVDQFYDFFLYPSA